MLVLNAKPGTFVLLLAHTRALHLVQPSLGHEKEHSTAGYFSKPISRVVAGNQM